MFLNTRSWYLQQKHEQFFLVEYWLWDTCQPDTGPRLPAPIPIIDGDMDLTKWIKYNICFANIGDH